MRELFSKANQDGTTSTFYSSDDGRVVWADISYPRNYQTLQEELEEQNKTLPKHKRKYLDESGKIISYLTAKKQGIVA